MAKEDQVERMFSEVLAEYGRIDFLVNNAGIQIAADSHALAAADFDKVLAVNLRGAFLCAREAIRHFLQAAQPAAIVNVSSVHQLIPKPRFLGYSVSKGEMQNLTRSLALEAHQRLRDKFTSLLDTMRRHEEVRENPHYLGGRLGISAVAHPLTSPRRPRPRSPGGAGRGSALSLDRCCRWASARPR